MRPLLVCLTLILLPTTAWPADTLRCGDRLVSTEAVTGEVLAACGEPDYRDAWYTAPGVAASDEEEWTYNFGASRLIQILHFRHGRLESIRADGYGFDNPPASRCEPSEIVTGLSKFGLLHRCGTPLTRESYDGLVRYHPGQPRYMEPIRREVWVYDFGADTRLRIVTLRNGRVVSVESGEAGSDSPR